MARAFLLAYAEERRKQANLRIKWRCLRDTSDPLQLPETEVIATLRLPKVGFQCVFKEICPFTPKLRRKTEVPNELKILAALNFYVSGSYQRNVGASFLCNMSQPTFSKCLRDVTNALISMSRMFCYNIYTFHHPNENKRK